MVNVPIISSVNLANADANLMLDSQNRLRSIGQCPNVLCLSIGSAQYAETGYNSDASWGRWKDGNVRIGIGGLAFFTSIPGEQSIHYLVGVPATALPTSGTFLYTQSGATSPTVGGASSPAGTFAGSLGVSFGSGSNTKVGLNGTITINGGTYTFTTLGGASNPTTSTILLDANARFAADIRALSNSNAGPLNCQGTTCTTQVIGGLFGPSGQTAGFTYRINNNGSLTINGVTVFVKP
jgi:hypothetical protein